MAPLRQPSRVREARGGKVPPQRRLCPGQSQGGWGRPKGSQPFPIPLSPGTPAPSLPAPAVKSDLGRSATPLKAGFSVFTELHNRHHCLILEHVHHPKKLPCTRQPSLPTPAPQPQANTHLLSISVALPIQNISRTWAPITCGLLCAAFSLSTLFSSFTHVVASVGASFLFTAE